MSKRPQSDSFKAPPTKKIRKTFSVEEKIKILDVLLQCLSYYSSVMWQNKAKKVGKLRGRAPIRIIPIGSSV